MENNRSYRIRTRVGSEAPNRIELPLTQTYDMFEILSLKLNQKNEYNYYDANYGVIVGRILANGGFGIPNARVSVFMPVEDSAGLKERILYNYSSTQDTNYDGVKYNLLPDFVDNACHQDVGTFPNKRLVLDNDDVIEIFDKYYKYTTVTNEAGDYMIFGVPTGTQTVHVDLDMSDIGVLSQRPRDMAYKGYNINQFESPNKFKKSTNLNSLSQLYSQDKGVYVYPYWGNSENRSEGSAKDTIAITRCDISIEYKFEPTAVFIGSIVTDKGSNAIGKNCTGTDTVGKMADFAAGEGSIEMIRKTLDNKVESFPIKGNRLINGDGVWCYQIPMNLDYIMTDEFGNIVPTDDPDKGIPTRTRVRFRISLDDAPSDATAHKRCRFLVPNNPRWDSDYPEFMKSKEADYEFGSFTREESYCDMFWNNVYTVKSYIPRLQKNKNTTNRKHTGIKMINHYGDNNPMPYNSLSIKLSFTYRFICILLKVLIWFIATINTILALIMEPICQLANIFLQIAKGLCFSILGIKPLCWLGTPFKIIGNLFMSMVVKGITLGSDFCDDGINRIAFYPLLAKIAPCVQNKIKKDFVEDQNGISHPEERSTLKFITITSMDNNELITCIENALAQENEATSFNFQNDWINGVLYAPLWYRKITPKKSFLFGLIKKKAKDQWCRADNNFNLMVYQACALGKSLSNDGKSPITGEDFKTPNKISKDCGKKCHEEKTTVGVSNGLILSKETMLGETVYYYKAINFERTLANTHGGDGVVLLFATDIVLLGSLNDCDMNGIPQFFKNLESTTYKLPTDILFTDTIIQVNADGTVVVNGSGDIVYEQFTEATGCDWGNHNDFDECGSMKKRDIDGGLFYGIGCSSIEMYRKSCLNLSRICEFGVSLDEAKEVADLSQLNGNDDAYEKLTPDGYISFDELYNVNERSMFATLNGNRLRTRLNSKNGLKEYDLRYLYVDNFDGLAQDLMRKNEKGCNYTQNFNLELSSRDYVMFRMGTEPFYYDSGSNSLPRYEDSFYFYFGLKMGKTAIDKFNSEFFSPCFNEEGAVSPIKIELKPNSWCSDNTSEADGYVILDLTDVSKPYDILINSLDNSAIGYEATSLNEDKLFLGENLLSAGITDVNLTINNEEAVDSLNEHIILKDNDGNPYMDIIPNGRYSLTVTDGDGEIITTKFTLMPKKVSFVYEKVDNEIPNNQRFNENESYDKIISKAVEKPDDYGGYILIKSIDNGDDTEGTYIVTVKPNNESDFNDYGSNVYKGDSCQVGVDENGNITTVTPTNSKSFKIIEKDSIEMLMIVTPKGGVNYKVTVAATCNGDDIGAINSSTATITIADTLPFKLFVNDIDVATLNKNAFNIGWTVENGNIKTPNITALAGWNNLSNIDNYNWDEVEGYEDVKSVGTTKSDEEKKFQEDYIKSVKNAFWLTSAADPKSIVVTVQTRKLPVDYYLFYNEEEDGDKQYVNQLTDGNENQYVTDGTESYYIDGVLIPTIVNKDNEDYGYDGSRISKAKNENISFGYDRTVGHGINNKGKYQNDEKWLKKPYVVRVVNSKGDVLPTNSTHSGYSLKLGGDSKEQYYFAFHIIDKVLRFNNMVCWSYINNLPYYGNDHAGKYIKMYGLLTGIINNGIVTEEDNNEYFETFQLDKQKDIPVRKWSKDTEDSIPTRRDIVIEHDKNTKPYTNYSTFNDRQDNYLIVNNKQEVLSIQDINNAYVSETIYGNMSIKLSNRNDNLLTFSLTNGDNNDNNRFYLFNATNTAYPLISYMEEKDDVIAKKTGDYGIMAVNESVDKLYESVDTNARGYYTDEEGNEKEWTEKKAFGTISKFKLEGDLNNRNFYVVAVTSNNCRTISPLYHITTVNIVVELCTMDTLVDKGNNVYENAESHSIALAYDNEIPYYLKYYPSTTKMTVTLSSNDTIEGEFTNPKIDTNTISYFNIGDTVYDIMEYYFNSDLFFNILLKSKFNKGITVTDVTGMPLLNNIQRGGITKYYGVRWDLSSYQTVGETDPLSSVTNVEEYVKSGTKYEEPIINIGNEAQYVKEKPGYCWDGWNMVTIDGEKAALWPVTIESSTIFKTRMVRIQCHFKHGAILYSTVDVGDDWSVTYTGLTPTEIGKEFKGWKYDVNDADEDAKGNHFIVDNEHRNTIKITVFAYFEDV